MTLLLTFCAENGTHVTPVLKNVRTDFGLSALFIVFQLRDIQRRTQTAGSITSILCDAHRTD